MISTWWSGDPLPVLPALSEFHAAITDDYELLGKLAHLDSGEVLGRVANGHKPYLACLAGAPVAYGWSARKQAAIGEVGVAFGIARPNRYLWDFATLPAWRGRGVYPRLLQAILEQEAAETLRFWIGHVPTNLPSARGIAKAGLRLVGMIERNPSGRAGFIAAGLAERAVAGATFFGCRGARETAYA
jgi:GNAT superfamily N-acetyltransferase